MTTKEPPKIHYMTHNFSDWDGETKHMTRSQRAIYLDLRTLYFTTAHKNNGAIIDDLPLLYFRLACHSDSDKADVDWLLKDKFKKIGKTYRHADWDKQIKDIRFAMRNGGNAGEKSNAKSNGSGGGGVTVSNGRCNETSNTHIYDHTGRYVMTGAQRTEKSRKLKALLNKGVQADKFMSLDTIRTLFDAHFNPCNAHSNATDDTPCNETCNDDCNAGNDENAENNHNPKTINHNPKTIECVNSQTLHTPTHTHFSKNLKSIADWQAPSVDTINGLLSQAGFGRTLTQDEYTGLVAKFKNYNVSRELQGHFLATEQVRIDKLIDWIKRERPVFNTPNPATSADTGTLSQPQAIDPKTMFAVGGIYKPCFDGYTPTECTKIIQEYRLMGETSFEAYERIKLVGVANCQKPQTASCEFVQALFTKHKTKPQQVRP